MWHLVNGTEPATLSSVVTAFAFIEFLATAHVRNHRRASILFLHPRSEELETKDTRVEAINLSSYFRNVNNLFVRRL